MYMYEIIKKENKSYSENKENPVKCQLGTLRTFVDINTFSIKTIIMLYTKSLRVESR